MNLSEDTSSLEFLPGLRKEASYPTFSPGTLAGIPSNIWFVGQTAPATQRRGRYVPSAAQSHACKMLPTLAGQLVETYTQPGDTVLDPMSGIGTTGVEAVHRGRHYVGLELEPAYIKGQLDNMELARSQGASGTFAVCRADARALDPLWLPHRTGAEDHSPSRPLKGLKPFDAILTSPPYGGRLEPPRNGAPHSYLRLVKEGKLGPTALPVSYRWSRSNLGNLKDDDQYFHEMEHVYAGCFAALKPGGILAIVLRVGRDGFRLRPLHHETARLCQRLGFQFLDEIIAILARVSLSPGGGVQVTNHASWIRRSIMARLRRRGYPVALNQVEYVLVFQKPGLDHPRPRSVPKQKTGMTS